MRTPATSRPRAWLLALAATALVLTACSDDDEQPPEESTSMKYCQLIEPETVRDIVGDLEVEAFGGPSPKTGGRLVQCTVYAPELNVKGTVLTVETRELGAPELAEPEKIRFDEAQTTAREKSEEYVELDPARGVGFASYDGQDASARLLTETRLVFATAPVDPDRAGAVTPQLLALVQTVDANLDEYDAGNP